MLAEIIVDTINILKKSQSDPLSGIAPVTIRPYAGEMEGIKDMLMILPAVFVTLQDSNSRVVDLDGKVTQNFASVRLVLCTANGFGAEVQAQYGLRLADWCFDALKAADMQIKTPDSTMHIDDMQWHLFAQDKQVHIGMIDFDLEI